MNKPKTYTYDYPRPAYSVDIAVLCENKILLIKRGGEPFKGQWALPGGFMDMDETPEMAASRELKEETNLNIPTLKQFKTYGGIDRDPRHRTISTIFYHQIESKKCPAIASGDDAAEAEWHVLNQLPELAFDHRLVIIELLDSLEIKA